MPSAPAIALAVGGPLAVALTWLAIRAGRVSIWAGMGSALGVLGVLALLTGEPRAAEKVAVPVAGAVGLAAGLLLYGATAAFMAVAGRSPPLARHTASLYDQRSATSLAGALAISVLVTVPGEELLWRGVVQGALEAVVPAPAAAVLGWAAYVAVNVVSSSLPIVLGAIVGGAAWAALALWSSGVIASIACHAVWTSLMILRPPLPRGNR
jgi:membrane protease YdiL (CAAX protease family)